MRAGVSQHVAMSISGHRTDAVFRRYNITTEDDLAAAVERVTAYVEKLPKKAKGRHAPRAEQAQNLYIRYQGSEGSEKPDRRRVTSAPGVNRTPDLQVRSLTNLVTPAISGHTKAVATRVLR